MRTIESAALESHGPRTYVATLPQSPIYKGDWKRTVETKVSLETSKTWRRETRRDALQRSADRRLGLYRYVFSQVSRSKRPAYIYISDLDKVGSLLKEPRDREKALVRESLGSSRDSSKTAAGTGETPQRETRTFGGGVGGEREVPQNLDRVQPRLLVHASRTLPVQNLHQQPDFDTREPSHKTRARR